MITSGAQSAAPTIHPSEHDTMRTRTTFATAVVLAVGTLAGWMAGSGHLPEVFAQQKKTADATPRAPADFKGEIKLDIRNSKPDWTPFTPKAAPKGAPNVLVILYDDTGLAAWSPYGGRINMPTLDKLAKNGLTYTQWHTTALC